MAEGQGGPGKEQQHLGGGGSTSILFERQGEPRSKRAGGVGYALPFVLSLRNRK